MTNPVKYASIMCFHDELCQVFNALMTALSLLRNGAKVTLFFGSRGVNALHKDKVATLQCLPDMPEMGKAVTRRMDEMDLPTVEDLFFMFTAEGGEVLACPLNVPLFGMSERDLIEGAKLADPARYYQDVVIAADMNLTF
ncbi:MAG: DsrE/DsrF/DrsH-like family protein [Betaproteobacteria bacterium]|nr:DsrE/DsrF/DrsH-like family protein [Betaproteobacteria bacterium]